MKKQKIYKWFFCILLIRKVIKAFMCMHMQYGVGFVVTDYELFSTVVLQERTCQLSQCSVLPLASKKKLDSSWTSNRQTL